CVLFAASTAFGFAAAGLASAIATPEFLTDFTAAARRERVVLFPLGVATSIATFVALMRHGHLRSRRTRLQLAAVVLLFVSGALANGPIASASEALIAASGGDAAAALFDHWARLRWLSFGLVVATVVALGVAHRQPAEVIDETRGLTSRHRLLLFLLGAATLFEGYDRFIVSLALPYIGADLGASESTLGWALSAIRLGALASIPLGRVADRRGRRGLLLFTILAYTIATAATGFSTGIVTFVAFQLLATIFLLTELSLAQVVIAEEFPRDFRAQGQAMLGAFGALGAGLCAVIFPMFQQTALGWRGLYFVGLLPLLLIAWLRRALPETERWQQARDEGRTERAG
ncbi:MAG: MFS transporter, partial [Candidatus Binatia bacterium]